LEIVDADHPIFEGLEKEALATLTEAHLRGFYRLDEKEGDVLVRFAGGGGAVVEIAAGRGRVLVCGFDTSTTAGDLPWSPMFLPLVQRMTGYLATAGWGRNRRDYEVGERIAIDVTSRADDAEATVQLPDGTRQAVRLDASQVPARAVLESTDEPGLYTFARGGEDFATVAVNVSRAESRRDFLTAQQWESQMDLEEGLAVRDLEGSRLAEQVRQARQGRPIHRWFFFAAFVLLLIEGMVSRRVRASRPGQS
jgi:hypothetical protein